MNKTSGRVVAARVEQAATPLQRLRGWLGRSGAGADDGLWLTPCNGIHTFGMRFPIDVLILDRDLRVVRIRSAVPPNRIVLPAPRGHSTLELAAGAIRSSGTDVGDQLSRQAG